MPAAAHMARRPLRISFRARSLADASVLPMFKGLKLKSPGARLPDFRPSVTANPEMISKNPMKMTAAKMGPALLSTRVQKVSTWFLAVGMPGTMRPDSCASRPRVASMATLACLSSASRIQYRSMPMSSILDRPRGSKPSSPARVPSSLEGLSMKGRDLLRSAIMVDMHLADLAEAPEGAKAAAEPIRQARIRTNMVRFTGSR
mmetsp:Transcript_17441/g.38041  ORF Transcript_17441/g.38041 Transcript_17441/m.38041 type:complete len:203 (+) Transcript_17441:281-889(+)